MTSGVGIEYKNFITLRSHDFSINREHTDA